MNLDLENKVCPFCGNIPDIEDYAFCYPVTRDKKVWQAGCIICDAFILGGNKEDAIVKWNKRYDTNK